MSAPAEWMLSNATEDAINAAVEQQQLEIRNAQRRIYTLLSMKNVLSPTGRLPTEVLGLVFSALVQAWVEDHYDDDFSPSRKHTKHAEWDWLMITRVCRRWTEVSLQTPQLWTYVSLNVKNVASYFLRSGQLPLTVLSPRRLFRSSCSAKIVPLLIANMQRIRNLCTPLDVSAFLAHATRHGALDAPLLEHLSVRFYGSRARVDKSRQADPDVVHRASWPRLRSLTVTGSPAGLLEAAMQPALTFLQVERPRRRMSLDAWVELLQNTPLLESLHLENAIGTSRVAGDRSMSAIPSVALPSLKYLALNDSSDSLGNEQDDFLKCLVIPPEVRIVYYEAEPASLQAVFEALAYNARGGPNGLGVPRRAVHAVNLGSDGSDGPTLEFFADDHTLAPGAISEPLREPKEHGYTDITLGQPQTGIIASVCSHYPLDQVRRFRLIGDANMNVADWDALGRLPSLAALEVAECHPSAALCNLHEALARGASFPALEILILDDIRWHPSHGDVIRTEWTDASADQVVAMLGDALAARRQRGTPLKKFALLSSIERRRGEIWSTHKMDIEHHGKHVEEFYCPFDDPGYESVDKCSGCGGFGTITDEDEDGDEWYLWCG